MNNNLKYYSIWELITKISRRNKNNKNIDVYTISNSLWIIKSSLIEKNKTYKKNKSDYFVIKKWEIWYNESAIDVWSIWEMKDDIWLISSAYTTFQLNNNIILNEYFLYLLKTNTIQHKIKQNIQWWAKHKFDFNNWNKIYINVPTIEKQIKIINSLNKINILKEELNNSNNLILKLITWILNEIIMNPIRNEWMTEWMNEWMNEWIFNLKINYKNFKKKYL